MDLRSLIREVPDFPRPGILFYDITPVFRSAEGLKVTMQRMSERYRGEPLDAIAAVEARGFVLGAALACTLGVGLILIRKPGKLPWRTEGLDYALEYGSSRIEAHVDSLEEGQRVLVVDDVLATGGTAAAARDLVSRLGGVVHGYAFLVELGFLGGRARLGPASVFSLVHYA